jgi:hypothetical protein
MFLAVSCKEASVMSSDLEQKQRIHSACIHVYQILQYGIVCHHTTLQGPVLNVNSTGPHANTVYVGEYKISL